jgi:dihydroorotase
MEHSEFVIDDVRTAPGGPARAVWVLGGRIAGLEAAGLAPAGLARVEGRGLLALPAGVDFHVHFRTPGGEHKETLQSGARAAVKGGIGTCGDMPNTAPPTTTLERLEQKLALAEGAPARIYFHFGAAPDNLAEVKRAARHPRVKALKVYMGPSTGQGGLAPEHVEAHLRQAAELGLPVIVHAEDLERIRANERAYPHLVRHHGDLRPLEAELAAVRQALALAAKYPVRLCIAHCTSARVIELAERSGIRERVFVEVAPHHLLLTGEGMRQGDCRGKVNPPLRPEAERAALFARLAEGIDGLGSDHAPHTLAEKALPYDQAPSGIPGVEYQLPLALTWWALGRYDLARLVGLTGANAARFFGLDAGALAPGHPADIVLVDPDALWTIARGDDAVASQCGWTPYAGMRMRGRVEMTFVGGRLVWSRQDGWADPAPAASAAPAPGPGPRDDCCG